MISVTNRFNELLGGLGASRSIAAVFRPQLYDIPMVSKRRIAP
jgi:hypothetical protein